MELTLEVDQLNGKAGKHDSTSPIANHHRSLSATINAFRFASGVSMMQVITNYRLSVITGIKHGPGHPNLGSRLRGQPLAGHIVEPVKTETVDHKEDGQPHVQHKGL